MSVTREEVLRIAQLAELDVAEDQLSALAEQMSRILEYVAQLSAVPANVTKKLTCASRSWYRRPVTFGNQ